MPRVLAIAAHPDDVEFLMAGTLLLLRAAGWETHYFNIARGNLGSMQHPQARIAAIRRGEARAAANLLGATWHPPICNDLEIFYSDRLLRGVCAVVREVVPTIVLTHSPEDYMEDHMITSRLAVTAAFARAMRNYESRPKRKATTQETTVYHAMPHGLRDGMRQQIVAELYVNTTRVHAEKRAALACHRSQKEWLDVTQGMDSYLATMDDFSRQTGRLSQRVTHAEGWRRHAHLGFSREDADPLVGALPEAAFYGRSPS
jgi:LmbE family N-acetylglucosaminyl deacetylase